MVWDVGDYIALGAFVISFGALVISVFGAWGGWIAWSTSRADRRHDEDNRVVQIFRVLEQHAEAFCAVDGEAYKNRPVNLKSMVGVATALPKSYSKIYNEIDRIRRENSSLVPGEKPSKDKLALIMVDFLLVLREAKERFEA